MRSRPFDRHMDHHKEKSYIRKGDIYSKDQNKLWDVWGLSVQNKAVWIKFLTSELVILLIYLLSWHHDLLSHYFNILSCYFNSIALTIHFEVLSYFLTTTTTTIRKSTCLLNLIICWCNLSHILTCYFVISTL